MIKDVLNRLKRALGEIATDSNIEQRDSALRAVSNALDETYLYYRDLKKGMVRNLDRESLLAKYWSAAAIPISNFDTELAVICDIKSEYWTKPDNYSDDEIKSLNIELDSVRQAYRKHIRNRYSVIRKN
jgi:hypothetical protein